MIDVIKNNKGENSNIFNSQNNNVETIYNYTPMNNDDNGFSLGIRNK